jgi:hypothetical protein
MLVNSPGPDTRGGAAGYACVAWLTGVLLSASEADGGALNMLVNSPGMDEFEGVADGEIAEPIANVPPGVAGSSGNAGENAAGIACVLEAAGRTASAFPAGDGMRIVVAAETAGGSSAGNVGGACGADSGTAGIVASPPCAA